MVRSSLLDPSLSPLPSIKLSRRANILLTVGSTCSANRLPSYSGAARGKTTQCCRFPFSCSTASSYLSSHVYTYIQRSLLLQLPSVSFPAAAAAAAEKIETNFFLPSFLPTGSSSFPDLGGEVDIKSGRGREGRGGERGKEGKRERERVGGVEYYTM